jgi:hypothetical protein
MASPWIDGEGLNASKMQARVTTPINDLADQTPQGFVTEAASGGSVTLATAGVPVAGAAAATFTLTTQRRVRIEVNAQFIMSSGTNGRYWVKADYNAGSSPLIGSVTEIGRRGVVVLTATGSAGAASAFTAGSVLLPAGTYTAYGSCTRSSGGSGSDTAAGEFYVAVYDVGPS